MIGEGTTSTKGSPGGGRRDDHRRRKPRSLPPMPHKPTHPIISKDQAEGQVSDLSSSRFIGSPPPSMLRGRDQHNRRDSNGNYRPRRRHSDDHDYGDEERTVYRPANPELEVSQPRITLHTAPTKSETPPPHSIVTVDSNNKKLVSTASSLSLRSFSSAASDIITQQQVLTPPPKLVSYRGDSGTKAVQEWVPEDESGRRSSVTSVRLRKNSMPSIRDLPTPIQGVDAMHRPSQPLSHARRTKSTVKLFPINK
ncbi:unnamed protein product [Meganyctiphanes norvegica]|uniref:Uncharacterized protein n=1 Tax=Meganyctiphanes norvegica TaxID=48144 RepID=A0AAV2QUP0_MEGNR